MIINDGNIPVVSCLLSKHHFPRLAHFPFRKLLNYRYFSNYVNVRRTRNLIHMTGSPNLTAANRSVSVRGNLASYGHRYPWRVLVSGLKASDIEQLKRFASGGYCDDSTIVYMQHPCVILTALEVLGYKVVASSSTSVKQDYNEYMWTMRKEFSEPEPTLTPDAVKNREDD